MLRALVAAACLIFCGTAQAQTATGVATIEARLTPEGLRADVRLSRAVMSFTFAQADVVREADFTLLTEGLTLSGDTVSAAAPFRRFSVLVRPVTQERDAKYPTFYRLGDGGVLYGPALIADGNTWRTTLRLRAGRGNTVVPATGPDRGWVFIGPRSSVHALGDMTLIAAADASQPLRDVATQLLRTSSHFYAGRLGITLPTPPTMALSVINDPNSGGFRGDVTPGPVVSLRFYGDGWAAPDASSRGDLSRFIAHESFHFWNGSLTSNSEGTPSWLHEGGAEYAALLSALRSGDLDNAALLTQLSNALTGCEGNLRRQGDVAMNDMEFLPAGVRYPCGVLIQWAADISIRAASHGDRDVLDAWGDVMRTALTRTDHKYTLADFTSYDGMTAGAVVITQLTEQSGRARWGVIVDALRTAGATIETGPSNWTRAQAVIMHLVRATCASGSYGFGANGGQVTLEAECGIFQSRPQLTSIEGAANPTDVSPELYERVRAICARQGDVALVLNGDERVNVPCRTALPAPDSAYAVTASPTLN